MVDSKNIPSLQYLLLCEVFAGLPHNNENLRLASLLIYIDVNSVYTIEFSEC